MYSRIIIVGALAAIGLLAPMGQVYAGSLDGGAIKGLFPGYFEATAQGYRILFWAYGNGRLSGKAYGRQDQGLWFVSGNNICVSWDQWTKGKSTCGSISQQGGWFIARGGGKEILKFRRTIVAQTYVHT